MNPWGLLEGASDRAERSRLRGTLVSAAELGAGVNALATSPLAADAVSVVYAPFDGHPYFAVDRADGTRVRLDGAGREAPLTRDDVAHVATLLANGARVARADWLEADDAYFFARPDAPVHLPVMRVVTDDAASTRYYVDPVRGALVAKFDRNARGYRWLHQGLHRLDFAAALRRRPARDVVMLALLAGVLAVTGTGLVLGARRLRRRFQSLGWRREVGREANAAALGDVE